MTGWTIISVSLCLLSIVFLSVFVLCCSKRRKNRKINKTKTKKGTKVATTPIEIKIESQINVDTSNIELQVN